MKNCAVVLAAGEGSRMKTALPKAMTQVLFKPLIDWVISALRAADVEDICVVTGYKAEYIEEHIDENIRVVRQSERLGTGHAVLQAEEFIREHVGANTIILNADAPFIDSSTIEQALAYHIRKSSKVTVITAKVDDPFGYGRIIRDKQGDIKAIVEEKNADDLTKIINEVNSGAYCFDSEALLDALYKITPNSVNGEYYLTDSISIILESGGRARAFTAESSDTVLGANSRKQLNELNEIARQRIFDRLWAEGVDIPCTDGVMIGPDVTIGRDTRVLPGTIICGKVEIGDNCTIGPNSYIENCVIGDRVKFNSSQARNCEVRSGADIGPFSQLRPDCVIGENVHIGDFVEVKNSNVGSGTKISHLTYVGDSDVGSDVNFGCGVVTVNYTGKSKHRTTIKDGAFIGCNTNLIAPVTVGLNAYTAAGSTITEDIPDNSLGIARERQTNKDDWVVKTQPYKKKV